MICPKCKGNKGYFLGGIEFPCIECRGTGDVVNFVPATESVESPAKSQPPETKTDDESAP